MYNVDTHQVVNNNVYYSAKDMITRGLSLQANPVGSEPEQISWNLRSDTADSLPITEAYFRAQLAQIRRVKNL